MDDNQMMLEYLMQMGALQPEQEAISRQRVMADQLRQGGQMPGMRQAGRVAVAANPLEFLSAVGSNYGALQKDKKADTMQEAYKGKRMAALGDLRTRMGQMPKAPIVPPAGDDPYGVGGW
jgi:hypothetical protein